MASHEGSRHQFRAWWNEDELKVAIQDLPTKIGPSQVDLGSIHTTLTIPEEDVVDWVALMLSEIPSGSAIEVHDRLHSILKIEVHPTQS